MELAVPVGSFDGSERRRQNGVEPRPTHSFLINRVVAMDQAIAEPDDAWSLRKLHNVSASVLGHSDKGFAQNFKTAVRPRNVSAGLPGSRPTSCAGRSPGARFKDVKQELASSVVHRFLRVMPRQPFGNMDCEWNARLPDAN